MNTFVTEHWLFFVISAAVIVVLLALTLRSVWMRERAMVRQRRLDAQARAAYEEKWRREHPAA